MITLAVFHCQEVIPGQTERKFWILSHKPLAAYTEAFCSLHFIDTQKPPNTQQVLQTPPFASNPKVHPKTTCMDTSLTGRDFSRSSVTTGRTGAGLIPSANWQQRIPFIGTISPYTQGQRTSHRLTTRISVPRHSARACRTSLFLILRRSSIVERMSFCLPIAAEVPVKQCQRKGSS